MSNVAKLSPDEVALVTTQLESTFVDSAALCSFLQRSESPMVSELLDVIRTDKKRYAIDDVREHAHASGILGDLFIEIAKRNPRRASLQSIAWHFIAKYKASDAATLSTLEALNGEELYFDTQSLEGLTSFDPFLNVSALESWCADVKKRVCQIRCGTEEKGTGFLIGAQYILTCYHVIETHTAKNRRDQITARFDYVESESGAAPSSSSWQPLDGDWEIPYAKYNKEEAFGAHPLPDSEELDFAILRLKEPAGGGRGCFHLCADVDLPPKGTPIIIAGHPGPAPLQPLRFSMAAPGLEGTNRNATRLIYKTSTKKGSSGSPVFDRELQLIGIHHNSGQLSATGSQQHQNNRGIPISSIYAFVDKLAAEDKALSNAITEFT